MPVFIFALKFYLYVIPYLIVFYFLSAYLNNSFVIVKDELIVINPNFPFKKITVYKLCNIEKIRIDKSSPFIFNWIFMLLECHFIDVLINNKRQRFYCIYLELDNWDDHLTEKTIEDFDYTIKKNKIVTEFN